MPASGGGGGIPGIEGGGGIPAGGAVATAAAVPIATPFFT